jgi:pyruvate/2-oxoglutarate dehydrogenase complex dihydrolipoamide acyltransferase (E2) component
MATPIRMPRVGQSMTEATVTAWHVEPGDAVTAGQPLVTIETDKASYEVEAPADGILGPLAVRRNDIAPVGAILAYVLEPGESPPALPPSPQERAKASPKARRLAEERRIDIGTITGSGPSGLVTESDVERVAKAPSSSEAVDEWMGRKVHERRRLGPIQRASGRRTAGAWTTVPHIVQMVDVEMSRIHELRALWRSTGGENAAITFNDFIVRATAVALAENPHLNAAIDGDDLVLFDEVNAGIAVDTPRGLVVPVVRNADCLSLLDISRETRRLAAKARDHGLETGDAGDGTFTVSNLGAFGIRAGTPVLNAPEAMLAFVGTIEDRPVVRDGAVVIRPMMTLSVAYDHRVADGATAARVTRRIQGLLEEPDPLLDGLTFVA